MPLIGGKQTEQDDARAGQKRPLRYSEFVLLKSIPLLEKALLRFVTEFQSILEDIKRKIEHGQW